MFKILANYVDINLAESQHIAGKNGTVSIRSV